MSFTIRLYCPSHLEMQWTFLSLVFGICHVIYFDQWNVSRDYASRSSKCACGTGLSLLYFFHHENNISQGAHWTQKDEWQRSSSDLNLWPGAGSSWSQPKSAEWFWLAHKHVSKNKQWWFMLLSFGVICYMAFYGIIDEAFNLFLFKDFFDNMRKAVDFLPSKSTCINLKFCMQF